jgi:hypothetical protein
MRDATWRRCSVDGGRAGGRRLYQPYIQPRSRRIDSPGHAHASILHQRDAKLGGNRCGPTHSAGYWPRIPGRQLLWLLLRFDHRNLDLIPALIIQRALRLLKHSERLCGCVLTDSSRLNVQDGTGPTYPRDQSVLSITDLSMSERPPPSHRSVSPLHHCRVPLISFAHPRSAPLVPPPLPLSTPSSDPPHYKPSRPSSHSPHSPPTDPPPRQSTRQSRRIRAG